MIEIWDIIEKGLFWAILDPFSQFGPNENFFEKSGSVTFVPLWTRDFMQKIRKIILANSEKSALQDERTNERTYKGEFIGHLWLKPGDQ